MLTGLTALIDDLRLDVPRPHTESHVRGARRHSEHKEDRALEVYSRVYDHPGEPVDHILFALKHEPLDLGVLCAAFKKLGGDPIRDWVLREPTGAYARKTWFLFEYLTGSQLDLPDTKAGNYTELLSAKRHIVGVPVSSRRHRVRDNLLGIRGFCPIVRRTQKLTKRMAESLDKEAETMTRAADPELLRRAIRYLYTKETKSTFEIEGEKITGNKEERFIASLSRAADLQTTDKAALIDLQKWIVEPRYQAADWRDVQNQVSETVSGYRERIHFVCPKPEDVPTLMQAWAEMGERVLADEVDPVIAAALVAFGFVFVHPFEDGNGRIHRFLVHNVLARRGFSPKGIIFPVSVAIARDQASYDVALENFSKPLLSIIDWRPVEDPLLRVVVTGDTADYYRYFDATIQVEYLYDRVAETIRKDLAEELDFLGCFERACKGVSNVVDMPNHKLSLFVRLVMQNGGNFPKSRRKHFEELTDDEIVRMEAAVQEARNAPDRVEALP